MPSNSDQHKVPSILTYNSKGEVSSWGYRLDSHRHQISWFKLGLSEYGSQKLAQEQPERSQLLKALMKTFKKEPVEIVGDYLRCLWTHATESIQNNIGRHLWESLRIKVVVTVPAIWDYKAQELTKTAAVMAGLLARTGTTLELIGEPEAAALAVFDEMIVQKKRNLQVSTAQILNRFKANNCRLVILSSFAIPEAAQS
jgi:molecular chaperone DnaK (HSP70)